MTTLLIAGGGTGGHLMPALAIADAVRAAHPDWAIVLAGAERGIEARLLPTRPYRHHLLPAEPLYRRQWWKNFRWPLLSLRLIRRVHRLLAEERPTLVLGTGGYAAGPVVWRAAARGIPTALFEADAYPGLTTRLLARRAREIYLGVPEAARHLRAGRRTEVVVTGPPIIPPDPGARARGLAAFGLDLARPTVLVTGGSQGALALNEAVAGWIRAGGTRELQVIWSTGPATHERFAALDAPPAVQVRPFLDPIAEAYAVADLAITRAGMTTIAELSAWGIPSILVPLPTAAADHQHRNAAVMADAGAAVLLPQSALTPDRLGLEVGALAGDRDRLTAVGWAARTRGRPDAAARIVTRLERLSGAV